MHETQKKQTTSIHIVIQVVIGLLFVCTLQSRDTLILKMEMYSDEKRQITEDLEFDSLFIESKASSGELIPLVRLNKSTFLVTYDANTLSDNECIYGCVKFQHRYYPFALHTYWMTISDTLQINLYRSTNWFKKSYGVLISRGNRGYSRAVDGCKTLGADCLNFHPPEICKTE